MTIAPALAAAYPDLNDAQRAVIGHAEGPLLVVAGPGAGKTLSLVLRTINLLLLGIAKPEEIVVCTFTDKAAFELRDRISAAAARVGYAGDLSGLKASTIHSMCNRFLTTHRHRTPLGNNFETLDDLTQALFIFDRFDEIIGEPENDCYLGRWSTKWTAIEGIRDYFNKITEELVDPARLTASRDPFIGKLGQAYTAYRTALFEGNRLDFAHQQKLVHDLLQDSEIGPAVTAKVRFVMVDEYQDTNHIQEQILLKLVERHRNLCVVGDEDQSLYRFRGATVRNILEFEGKMPGCEVVRLTTNYRSHPAIIEAYDRWMSSADWSNPSGLPFRYAKTIQPPANAPRPDYPALFAIWGKTEADEGKRLADLVAFLKGSGVITDYSQVAILLHSVRQQQSGPFLDALEAKGIPTFCPRARAYFGNDEVRLMVAALAALFGWHTDRRGPVVGRALQDLADYVDAALGDLARLSGGAHPLAAALRGWVREIDDLKEGESLDLRPADFFYRLLSFDPFATWVKNENRARNLAILSQLLNTFQNYYHYTVVAHRNREFLRRHLFNSFLRLLHEGGMNEYEDRDQPLPKGYVQVMTIHQAKGLEFPVVVVGSLSWQSRTQKRVDRDLQPFYGRPPFEPEGRITHFDRMRLHYVAFSRPERLLVLSAHEDPKDHFDPIWQGLPQWPYVRKDLLGAQRFTARERMPVKRAFSFTGDLKVYETCPRQYQFFREYDFTPSRSAVIFFGLLVHQTIEEIHRLVLEGRLDSLDESRLRTIFERTFSFLCLADVHPIGEAAKEGAFRQVMNYFRQNQEEMKRVIETEVDVSVEKDGYILTGKIDLLMGGDGRLELLDFKTSPRPSDSPALLVTYERQLCTYAHILEKRHGKRVDRLFLYWTAEPRKQDALMEFPYRPERVGEAGEHFDRVVSRIRRGEFAVLAPPEAKICKECDLRRYCKREGTIRLKETDE